MDLGSAMDNTSKEQEYHVERLSAFCRLCDVNIGGKKMHSKTNFADEISKIFNIDVVNELKEIYPAYICQSCSRELYRYRSTGLETTVGYKNLSSIRLRVYSPHSDHCDICFHRTKGRPRKRGRTDIIPNKEHGDHASEMQLENTTLSDMDTDVHDMTDIETLLKHVQTVMSRNGHDKIEIFFSRFLDHLSTENLSVLCKCLGRKQRSDICRDSDTFSLLYKDMESLSDFKIVQWLRNRNDAVISYLLGICGSSLDELEEDSNDTLLVSRALEQLYSLCSRNLVSPVSFFIGLTAYAMTGSRTVVDILGNSSPSGHYKTVTKWLKDQASKPEIIPPDDVINVFDNEQVIGKSYSIRPQNKVAVSVITNKGFVVLQSQKILQTDASLKPVPVLNLKHISQDESLPAHEERSEFKGQENHNIKLRAVLHDMIDQESKIYTEMETDHNQQLYHFINHAIQGVMAEQKLKEGSYEDMIDNQVKNDIKEENFIECATCHTLNAKRKIVCTGCEGREGLSKAKEARKKTKLPEERKEKRQKCQKLSFQSGDDDTQVQSEKTEFSQFGHVPSNHSSKHEIILTDPVFCNPNSLASVAMVLRKIGEENGIVRYGGERRHWTFVCCDGLPYMIIKKLKEEAVVCAIPECKESFLTTDLYAKHASQKHSGLQKRFVYEFDWFYIRIGSGHYEMNLIKSFFELNWVPFLESLCEIMGFTSDPSKQFAKSCKDHHKSWRLLLIFHLGTLKELVLPYVRHCLLINISPTAKGFLTYSMDKYKSHLFPNFTYMMDQVCKFSQGIVNFRMATRRNNASLLKSAKYMTKEIFHGRSHPKYQFIEINDTIQDQMMEDEVRNLNDMYSSITTSTNFSTGEDLDFVLEEKNKQLKSWIPKGMPTDAIWQTVCRNNRALETIKERSLSLFGIRSDKGSATTRPLGIEEAIDAYRGVLRRTKYLEKDKDHVSLSGIALDEGLINFVQESTMKRIHLLQVEFLGKEYEVDDASVRHPVPITPAERERLLSTNNMTVKQIQGEISKLLDKIVDPFQFDYHLNLYQQEVKMKGKAKHVHFLQELSDVLESLSSNKVETTDEDMTEIAN